MSETKVEVQGMALRRRVGLVGGPLLFATLLLMPAPAGMGAAAWRCAACAALLALWWITEALPIAATALLPVVLFPLLAVASIKQATAPYAHPLIFLFMGGFMLALAVERWGLHRRIALRLLAAMGSREDALIGGVMLGGAAISMWVSNTATAVMLLPIATSVIELRRRASAGTDPQAGGFARALMLALAYSTSIGGLGTLIGTPPNALFAAFYEQNHGQTVSFARWMLVGVPAAALMLAAAWIVLTRISFRAGRRRVPGVDQLIAAELQQIGPISRPEIEVLVVFVCAATLWIGRPLLARLVPTVALSDAGIAMLAALCLFVVPVDLKRGVFLLDWPEARRLPWGVLLLFGGGLSLAAAISGTGLAVWIGQRLQACATWPQPALVLLIVTLVIFLTELTSNTATVATFLPVLSALANVANLPAVRLLVPATLAGSCAFMMPVATPPNAIVFASGALTIPQMARAGLLLNLAGIVVLSALSASSTGLL